MTLKFLLTLILSGSLSLAQTAPGAAEPVGKVELVQLVATGATAQRIMAFLEYRGIDFVPDESLLRSLELDLADPALLDALKSAKVIEKSIPTPSADAIAKESEVLLHLHLAAIQNRNNFHAQAAEPEFRAAVAADPKNAFAHLALGKVLSQLRQPNAAVAEFQTALKLKPGLAEAHLELARALVRDRSLGSEAKVLELKKAAELAPYDPAAQYAYESALLGAKGGKEETEKRTELTKKYGGAMVVPRIRVGGQVAQAKFIKKPPPQYPAAAKAAGTEGTVKLLILIGKDGAVKDWEVISGERTLVDAAVDAVVKWQYQPTLLNKQPVEVITEVDINFRLRF